MTTKANGMKVRQFGVISSEFGELNKVKNSEFVTLNPEQVVDIS